jgi:hypothetical protein
MKRSTLERADDNEVQEQSSFIRYHNAGGGKNISGFLVVLAPKPDQCCKLSRM